MQQSMLMDAGVELSLQGMHHWRQHHLDVSVCKAVWHAVQPLRTPPQTGFTTGGSTTDGVHDEEMHLLLLLRPCGPFLFLRQAF